jgi:hypothetical protein
LNLSAQRRRPAGRLADLQINIWNDAQRRAGDKAARIRVIEITREFESASKYFASFSKFFLGGIGRYQWVMSEKIWNREFSRKSLSG